MAVASIIIPTYQHAKYLPDSIASALAQTVPCEVIVVDDGSTDDTAAVVKRYGVKFIQQDHAGPSAARNAGIEAATGEFIMFLDADDVIAPTKIAKQLAAFTDDIGWVICDVSIEDAASGQKITASKRYGYNGLGGWIQSLLAERNIFPIMAPLVRRSVLNGIRFNDDLIPEDWHFWHAVAGAARVRYVPEVLATYRKTRTGRSRTPQQARKVSRNIVQPLRLNLGCGTEGTRSWHPIHGMVNLDKSMGWRFEDGLGDFVTGSVAGISISHALMYVQMADWPAMFAELARVLKPGGVLRITEDDTAHPESRTHPRGWHDAKTLTNPAMVKAHMERAGLRAYDVAPGETKYDDTSLIQQQHGDAPDCFWMEGVKIACVLFEPHADDAALFGSFTVLRYRPMVVTCYPSAGDYGDTDMRAAETREAMTILGGEPVEQWQGGDLVAQMREIDARMRPAKVFAPDRNSSHKDHVAVAEAAREVFGHRLLTYHTYNELGRVMSARPVDFEPAWVLAKLRALCRFESQATHRAAHAFFLDCQREYYGEGPE